MQKRLDGHQVSRCGRGGSGLPARLGGAQGDGASTENLRPLPGLKPLDAAPPTSPRGARRHLSAEPQAQPRPLHSQRLACGCFGRRLVRRLCLVRVLVYLRHPVTGSPMWWPVSHLRA